MFRQGFGFLVLFGSELVEVTELVEVLNAGNHSKKVIFVFVVDFSLDSFAFLNLPIVQIHDTHGGVDFEVLALGLGDDKW